MEIIGAFAPKRPETPKVETECLRMVRADLFTLGGAVMFAICLTLSAMLFMSSELASVSELQRMILAALTLAAWLYFLDSVSEKLMLVDHTIVYGSVFGRRRTVPLADLDAMLMVYEGFNLERGIESIEFRRHGQKPERLALGPCWQRRKLENFMRSVEEALRDPHLLENVR